LVALLGEKKIERSVADSRVWEKKTIDGKLTRIHWPSLLGEENIDKYRGAEQRRFEGLREEKIQKSRADKMVWLKKRYRGAE